MKIFTKKNVQQKIILIVLTVLCINFITPTYSQASLPGVIASPIVDFFCTLGDVVINVLQRCMKGNWGSTQALNMSLSAFLMESNDYYNSEEFYKPGKSKSESSNVVNPDTEFDKGWLGVKDEYYIPVATFSPEEIFAGKVSGLDINFINPKYEDGSAATLQKTISKWYVAIRNLATVGLLCVLVYVGIRMMLSSTANDKAKYKQMIVDWIIALCILFFMHYIMTFVLTLTDSICEALDHGNDYSISIYDESAGKSFSTNLLGLARFKTQYKDAGPKITYFIFYIALVAYTGIFAWHYLKRLIMMAFLTIIAPMVAFTYPIDKLGDGKAQAFNMWLKEYVYNALIQPFHLIIYTVFVGSAIDLVETNLLYALVCMGFILPAEKILKKMFGFDRAPLGTMGALAGFTLGSMFSGNKKGGSSSGAKANTTIDSANKPPRYTRTHGTDGISNPPKNYNQSEEKNSQEKNTHEQPINREMPKEDNNNTDEEKSGVEKARQAFEEQQKAQEEAMKKQEEEAKEQQLRIQQQELEQQQHELEQQQQELEQQIQYNSLEDEYESIEQEDVNDNEKNNKFKQGMNNIINEHGGGKQLALKGAKALGSGMKYAARTGFKLGGTAAGIGIGLASGKGLTGVIAGAKVGANIGNKMGNTVSNIPGKAIGVGRKAVNTYNKTVDTFNGNTEKQDVQMAKAFMKNKDTQQYIRNKWTKDHNGQAPTTREFEKEMDNVKVYANEGMTDIAQIYRARKAEKFGVSSSDAAKIALLAQDRKINSDVLGDEKKFNQRKQDFTQEFMDKGMDKELAEQKSDYILNVMKAQVGQKHNLEKVNTGANSSTSTKTNSKVNATNTSVTSTKSNSKVSIADNSKETIKANSKVDVSDNSKESIKTNSKVNASNNGKARIKTNSTVNVSDNSKLGTKTTNKVNTKSKSGIKTSTKKDDIN